MVGEDTGASLAKRLTSPPWCLDLGRQFAIRRSAWSPRFGSRGIVAFQTWKGFVEKTALYRSPSAKHVVG